MPLIQFEVQVTNEDVNPLTHQRPMLSNLRMLLSTIGEGYYISKNVVDHAVALSERFVFGEKYLKNRLKAYKGQKRLAFLYHGYFQTRAGFERLEDFLESPLFDVFAISGGYQPYSQDIRRSAEHEARIFEYVLKNTDAEEVYLIGHSQGGLIARYLTQKLGVTQKITKVITLATPHQGTYAGIAGYAHKIGVTALQMVPGFPAIAGESGVQMIPGSKFLRELNALPLPPDITWTSLYSYVDPLVWPASYARMPYSESQNILLKKIGHLAVLYNVQVYELVLRTLLLTKKGERLDFGKLIDRDVLVMKRLERQGQQIEEIVSSSD